LAPKGSLELVEEAWNAYPYCRTVVSVINCSFNLAKPIENLGLKISFPKNPDYMKDKFEAKIETIHLQDKGTTENVCDLNHLSGSY
jgi:hypothetical protein